MGSTGTTVSSKRDKMRAALRAAGLLLLALVPAILLLLWNKPSVKTVRFDLACERFQIPVPLTINLNHPPTQLQQVVLSGFGGQVSNVLSVSLNNAKPQLVPQSKFNLFRSVDPNETAPYLKEVPTDALGKMEIAAEPGVVFSSLTVQEGEPYLQIKSMRQGDTHFTMQSKAAQLDGERYAIPELFPSKALVEDVSMRVVGAPPGVGIDLVSGPAQKRPFDANLTFRKSDSELSLIDVDPDNPIPLGMVELQFHGVLNPDLRIEGKGAVGVVSGHNVDLRVHAESGKLLALGIVSSADKKILPAVHVRGELEARSLEQDGRELLPTLIEDILDKPYAERSAWLVCLGFLALLTFKMVDRALDVLLKLLLPEE
jgi:hypothetical protein